MPFVGKVGDRLAPVIWSELSIKDVYTSIGDFCEVPLIYDGPNAEHGKHILPLVGELLSIEYWDGTPADVAAGRPYHGTEMDPEILFRGPITTIELAYAPGGSRVSLQAEDLTFRLNSKMVAGVFVQRTVEEMVEAMVELHGPRDEEGNLTIETEFTSGPGRSILPRVVQWKEFGEILQEIAEERRYNWWVTFDGKLIVVPTTDPRNRAPIAEVRPVTDTRIRGLRYTISIAELKNAIYIKEFWFESPNEIHGPGLETASGADEELHIEPLGGRANPHLFVASGNVISDLSTFSVYVREGGETEFRLYPALYDAGPGTDHAPGYVYVTGGTGNFIIVRNNPDEPIFPADTVAYWRYKPLQKHTIPELVIDTESIAEFRRRETGSFAGNGEYQWMLSFGSLEFGGDNPFTVLHDYLRAYLNQYAWPIIEGSFTVVYSKDDGRALDDDGFGWQAGQAFDIFNDDLGLFSQPIFYKTGNHVPASVIVSSVTLTPPADPNTIAYEIEFTSQFSNV